MVEAPGVEPVAQSRHFEWVIPQPMEKRPFAIFIGLYFA